MRTLAALCQKRASGRGQAELLHAPMLGMGGARREALQFDARERAALGWAEALTSLDDGVPDAAYDAARAAFSERELAYLSSAVLAINAWNRLGVAYRFTPLPIPAPGAAADRAA